MLLGEVVRILGEVSLSALAAFMAIFLWSMSRDSAWIFIVLGTILKFGDVMYGTMEMFGIIPEKLLPWGGESVVKIVIVNVPYIFFILGFAIMISRNRLRLKTLERTLSPPKERKERKKIEGKPKKQLPEKTEILTPPPEAVKEPETVQEPEAVQELEAVETLETIEGTEDTAEEVAALEEAEPVEMFEDAENAEEPEELEELEELEEEDESGP